MTRMAMMVVMLVACGAAAPAAHAQDADGGGRLPGAQGTRKLDGGTAAYTCTARNALGTQQCTTTCTSRETADCEDADGSGTPTCQCTGG